MAETGDRQWEKPQDIKEFAKPAAKKPKPENVCDWSEFSNHPSWNNLFVLAENYVNECAKQEKKSRQQNRNVSKKVSIKKKYKKYKKRYKMIKNESRTSDSGYECTPRDETSTNCYDK